MNLMDVLDKKENLRQSANFSEVPAGFMQMLALGMQAGGGRERPQMQPQPIRLPEMNMQAPQVDMPDLAGMQSANTQAQRSQFEQDKYNKGEQDLANSGKLLSGQLDEQMKGMDLTSPIGKYFSQLKAMADSNNPIFAKSALEGYNNYNSSVADNFKLTSGQKELQDKDLQAEKYKLLNQGGVPQAFNRNDKGELVPATVAGTGQTYQQYQGQYSSPAEQERLKLSREQGDRQTVAAEKTAVAAEKTTANNQRNYETSTSNQLRDEFNTNTKDYRALGSAYGNIQQAFNVEKPTAATDMAGVFGYMKILDPTSVVREGEYATAQNAASVPERIRNYYNKTLEGAFLSPEQRKEFSTHSQRIYDQATKDTDKLAGQYRTRAAKMGVDPSYVITDYKSTYQKPVQFTATVPEDKKQAILDAIKSGQLDVEEGRKRGYIQ
jgi:hypothetical protein